MSHGQRFPDAVGAVVEQVVDGRSDHSDLQSTVSRACPLSFQEILRSSLTCKNSGCPKGLYKRTEKVGPNSNNASRAMEKNEHDREQSKHTAIGN